MESRAGRSGSSMRHLQCNCTMRSETTASMNIRNQQQQKTKRCENEADNEHKNAVKRSEKLHRAKQAFILLTLHSISRESMVLLEASSSRLR